MKHGYNGRMVVEGGDSGNGKMVGGEGGVVVVEITYACQCICTHIYKFSHN